MNGFLLSLDAVVAIGLLFLLASFLTAYSTTTQSPELQLKKIYYAGKDIHNVLVASRAGDVQEFQTIKDLINSGAIQQKDLNNSLLDILGFFWASGNYSTAQNITQEVLTKFLNSTKYGYEVILGNTTIYTKGASPKNLVKITSTVSGYDIGQAVNGWVASAWASKLKKRTTLTLPFEPEGSAVENGDSVTITKRFYLNSSDVLNIEKALLYLSIHFGNQDINSQQFSVNGNPIDGQITWLYEEEKEINGKTTQLYVGSSDVTDYLTIGAWNRIEIVLSGNKNWHSHIHPGFRLELQLEQNVSSLYTPDLENKTLYFDNIRSEASNPKTSGAWAILPFFIPTGATVKQIFLRLRGEEINNISAAAIPSSVPNKKNVQIYLNNMTVELGNPNASGVFDKAYNLTSNFIPGTNVISVYLNSYGDDFWGEGKTILMSDPQNNISFASNVNIVYFKPPNEIKPGKLAVGIKTLLGGNPSNPKNLTVNFNGSELFQTYLHITQLDSENISVYAGPAGQALPKLFVSPRPFATPSTIFIDPSSFNVLANNTLSIAENCTIVCDILPESTFEHFSWVPSLAGYGGTFQNQSAAVADALKRLSTLMGNYIQATELQNDTQALSDVPSLWGPVKLEIRVWTS